MIVATTPDGYRFYSNDGQLFQDGDLTIYSPQFLPEDTVLTSTELGVWMLKKADGIAMAAVDSTSGYVFWERDGLTMPEAGELAVKAFDEFTAEES